MNKRLNDLSGFVEEQELDALLARGEDPSGAGTPTAIIASAAAVTGAIGGAAAVSAAVGDACPTTACTKSC